MSLVSKLCPRVESGGLPAALSAISGRVLKLWGWSMSRVTRSARRFRRLGAGLFDRGRGRLIGEGIKGHRDVGSILNERAPSAWESRPTLLRF